jgi:hypothetical protein
MSICRNGVDCAFAKIGKCHFLHPWDVVPEVVSEVVPEVVSEVVPEVVPAVVPAVVPEVVPVSNPASPSVVETKSECSICFEEVDSLYLIDCGHCFCYTCTMLARTRNCFRCDTPVLERPRRIFF